MDCVLVITRGQSYPPPRRESGMFRFHLSGCCELLGRINRKDNLSTNYWRGCVCATAARVPKRTALTEYPVTSALVEQ